MNTIKITTQAELDALPANFETYTIIEINGGVPGDRIHVETARGNSSVEVWGNSSVEVWGNSSVDVWENSSVVARENSSVVARGNSSVVARENSSVVALENSSVVALENSSVEAWENSSVKARGNSSVEAYEFAMIAVLWSTVVIKHLADYSVASLRGVKPNILKKDDTATIVETPSRIDLPFETWLKRGVDRGSLRKRYSDLVKS